jgi:NTP pyrophosphatase (non-canonical NTP hydrolase)
LVNFGEELADTLIRVLDLASGLGIDLDSAVSAKLEKNKHRGYRHGGKRV